MTQHELNRAVARATGESVDTVQRIGFLLADPSVPMDADDDQFGPRMIDWDELDARRPESVR